MRDWRSATLALLLSGTTGALAGGPSGRAAPRPSGCEEYGTGFVRVDGSDTCARISGRVRVEAGIGGGGGGTRNYLLTKPANGPQPTLLGPRTDGSIDFDSRTGTSAGTVRTFLRVRGR